MDPACGGRLSAQGENRTETAGGAVFAAVGEPVFGATSRAQAADLHLVHTFISQQL
jgi:hypothetical protein